MSNGKKIVVIKYGSKCVINKEGLDQARIDEYARKIADLRRSYEVLVVASGSVAAGRRFLIEGNRSHIISDTQVLASIGSAGAIEAWRHGFKKQGIFTGQILVTHREIEDQHIGDNLISAIQKLFKHGIVAIVNENDILSSNELKKLAYGGDNDGLAAHLAIRLSAEAVVFLTDVEGYIEQGIVRYEVKLSEVENLQQHLQKSNEEGTGSMKSKLEAASSAVAANIKAHIANAETANYTQILDGTRGTEVVK